MTTTNTTDKRFQVTLTDKDGNREIVGSRAGKQAGMRLFSEWVATHGTDHDVRLLDTGASREGTNGTQVLHVAYHEATEGKELRDAQRHVRVAEHSAEWADGECEAWQSRVVAMLERELEEARLTQERLVEAESASARVRAMSSQVNRLLSLLGNCNVDAVGRIGMRMQEAEVELKHAQEELAARQSTTEEKDGDVKAWEHAMKGQGITPDGKLIADDCCGGGDALHGCADARK